MSTWKPAHVVVVGAGAMGCLFGGLLKEGGLNVTLVDVWREHVDAIHRDGLRILGYGGDRSIPVRAALSAEGLPPADVVLVQCKAHHTRAAVGASLTLFGEETVAISFQNGLGNEKVIGEVVGMERVLGGLTAQGASVESPGVIRNYSELPSYIGEMGGGSSERALRVAEAFTAAGLPTHESEDIRREIWKKLMANLSLSPASALADLSLDDVVAVPELRDVLFEAVDEAAAVARASGINLENEEAREVLHQLTGSGGTGANKSSICRDILHKRPTEIDYINGAVVRLGESLGIPTPVNRVLVAAVKALESKYAPGINED